MSRLEWFPFFVNHYLGGTHYFTAAEHGAYLLLLCAQWASKDRQGVSNNPDLIKRIIGSPLTEAVRQKFIIVKNGTGEYLRNERLAAEWTQAKYVHQQAVKGGKNSRRA